LGRGLSGFIATRMKEIRDRHGPDALAFLNSHGARMREAYLLQKLAAPSLAQQCGHGAGVYCNNSINVPPQT